MLAASPPPKKKQKVGELGVGLSTDAKEELVKEEVGTPEKVPERRGKRRGEVKWHEVGVVKKLLKDCGFGADFKVMGSSACGPTVGCLACMKKQSMKESTSGQHAGDATVDALRIGNWAPATIPEQCIKKFKKTLNRHLSGKRHWQASKLVWETSPAGRRVIDAGRDVPSDAQMRIVYDEVKKSPMVPPPCCLGRIAVICCGEQFGRCTCGWGGGQVRPVGQVLFII